MTKVVELEKTRIRVVLYKSGMHEKEYDCYLEEGNWPGDSYLIDISDGGDPTSPYYSPLHNGGKVLPGESLNHKIVKVFV